MSFRSVKDYTEFGDAHIHFSATVKIAFIILLTDGYIKLPIAHVYRLDYLYTLSVKKPWIMNGAAISQEVTERCLLEEVKQKG